MLLRGAKYNRIKLIENTKIPHETKWLAALESMFKPDLSLYLYGYMCQPQKRLQTLVVVLLTGTNHEHPQTQIVSTHKRHKSRAFTDKNRSMVNLFLYC